jgi:hypothetical protein
MESINKINKGLHSDFNEYEQPANTMRDNRNGVIMDLNDGDFVWTNLSGTKAVSFTLDPNDNIMGTCFIRNDIYMIVFNNDQDYVIIYRAKITETGDISDFTRLWEGENTEMKLSLDHPIRSMFGYYENEDIQRIYWTDFNNQPRAINIGSEDRLTIEEKFIDFFPGMDPVYGNISFAGLSSGGACRAGSYFFAWRFFNEGYYTDWSYLSEPVPVMPNSSYGDYDVYHEVEGAAPNKNTNNRVKLKLTDLDTDYSSIQIAAFYSNDYNSAESGFIFYDGDITGSTMEVFLNGNENLGTVVIDDLINVSTLITKCKDMTHISKMNVLANIEERAELDLTGVAPYDKNNQIEVEMTPIVHPCLLDSKGYPDKNWSGTAERALSGIRSAAQEYNDSKLIPGIWYRAVGGSITFQDDEDSVTHQEGEVFQLISSNISVTPDSGTAEMVIVISKYKPVGAVDINDHELEVIPVTGFYNYKNPLFSNKLKGYPRGEAVRFGVQFFDKTGRPYFTRHLFNTIETNRGYVVGPGDYKVPGDYTSYDQIASLYDKTTVVDVGDIYKHMVGRIMGVEINGIDVTSIADKIGGFSIVRAPIERSRIAYGFLSNLYETDDEFTVGLGVLIPDFSSPNYRYNGSYAFHCPEDIYELTNFNIQIGDELVNAYYLDSYGQLEEFETNRPGMGRYELDIGGIKGLYQKYAVLRTTSLPDEPNAQIGVSHEIKNSLRYKIGDDTGDGVAFDPDNPGIVFKEKSRSYPNFNEYSYASNCNLLVLDIDESGNDTKTEYQMPWNDSKILMCYIKRENSNPYGGIGDSALSNTVYKSTGHYQKIDSAILAEIDDGVKKVFNGIHVYGGDSFVSLFSKTRLLQNYDIDPQDDQLNTSFIVPIETRVNIDLKEGNNISFLRSYHSTNPSGIKRETGNFKLEEFNYNDGYSTDDINDYSVGFPFNANIWEKFDTRLRFSEVKSLGEREDSFRQFPSLNILDLESEYGEVNNIRRKQNRLIFWQRDTVGYVPINERALTANQFGDPVQLGVGGVFDRHDEVINMLGNSNQFGLVESAAGFHWYDAVRKEFVTLRNVMQFDHDSIAKGISNWLGNNIWNNMDTIDNPLKYEGVVSGYDVRNKMILMTFMYYGQSQTIGLNIKGDSFVGFFDLKPSMFFNHKSWLYSVDNSNYIIYQHNAGPVGSYHGEIKDQYFSIIVKGEDEEAKIFDTFEYIGSQETFSSIRYQTDTQFIQENTSGNRNLKFRNKRYYGNFPKIKRERLVDGWVKITFLYSGSNPVSFNQLKSVFRKMI